MKIKDINEAKKIRGKRVLLRLDLNVPLARGKVVDDFRIKAALPTINMLRDAGAKTIIISHIEGKGGESLSPVADYLVSHKVPVTFISKFFTAAAQKTLDGMKDGDIVLFENVRINKGEKANDPDFARKLADMADMYVNEAFPVSHRAHASIVGVPKFIPSYAGPTFMREIENLSMAFNPPKPFLFILGGAKFDTKMPLIQKFMKSADMIYVGGALANNFFKELKYETGTSSVSEGEFDLSGLLQSGKVFIPIDVVVSGKKKTQKPAHEVEKKEAVWDIGNESLLELQALVKQAAFVLWNGPMGNYELDFVEGTKKVAEIVARSNAKSIVGGGDTVAAIQSLGLMEKFTFVSTGGGAMLDFLVQETLPGIDALKAGK
jgi:phosphoglycerate kinase